jgi:hypothetical protein
VTAGQFAASLALGVLSVVIPLALFIGVVAACVWVARWWTSGPENGGRAVLKDDGDDQRDDRNDQRDKGDQNHVQSGLGRGTGRMVE